MEEHDKKYGIDSEDKRVKDFHSQRRMFLILNSEIYLSPGNVTRSHEQWFEKLGFNPTKEFMNKNPRGYWDNTGLYFYKGYDHSLDEETEKIVLENLKRLVNKTGISLETHLFGGIMKQSKPGKWPPEKDYGTIKNLII